MTTTDEPRRPEAPEPEAIDPQAFRVWTESLQGERQVAAYAPDMAAIKKIYHGIARSRGTELKEFGWEARGGTEGGETW